MLLCFLNRSLGSMALMQIVIVVFKANINVIYFLLKIKPPISMHNFPEHFVKGQYNF